MNYSGPHTHTHLFSINTQYYTVLGWWTAGTENLGYYGLQHLKILLVSRQVLDPVPLGWHCL